MYTTMPMQQQQRQQHHQKGNNQNNNNNKKRKQKTAFSVLALLALWSGLNLSGLNLFSSPELEQQYELDDAGYGYNGDRRSLRTDAALLLENKVDGDNTITITEGNANAARDEEGKAPSLNQKKYVISEAALEDRKEVAPVINGRNANNEETQAPVIDVVSIGSEIRPHYLKAQIQTWASHPYIRNYWGFMEADDYDTQCDTMDDETLYEYVQTCRSPGGGLSEEESNGAPFGWDGQVERFVTNNYASTHNEERAVPGWICAQRRPGRALGWLQNVYGKGSESEIPDILVIVDDDTSLDVEKMKWYMQGRAHHGRNYPYVSAGCVLKYGGFDLPYGGFGTFLNKAAIEVMTQPVYCDEETLHGSGTYSTRNICAQLKENRIGERAVYQPGDSVFDIFYKYSAQEYFCMHSDWALGYMITYYSGGSMNKISPQTCKRDPCTPRSVSCHEQTPMAMEMFTLKHRGLSWGYKFGSVQA